VTSACEQPNNLHSCSGLASTPPHTPLRCMFLHTVCFRHGMAARRAGIAHPRKAVQQSLFIFRACFFSPPTLLTGGCSWTRCASGTACEAAGGKDALPQMWQQGGLARRIRATCFSLQSLTITAPSPPPLRLFLLVVSL